MNVLRSFSLWQLSLGPRQVEVNLGVESLLCASRHRRNSTRPGGWPFRCELSTRRRARDGGALHVVSCGEIATPDSEAEQWARLLVRGGVGSVSARTANETV